MIMIMYAMMMTMPAMIMMVKTICIDLFITLKDCGGMQTLVMLKKQGQGDYDILYCDTLL